MIYAIKKENQFSIQNKKSDAAQRWCDEPCLACGSIMEWQCVAVSQCVTVCCSVLQCVAVCCSVVVCCSVLQSAAVCCSVSQRVAVCCSVLQCAAVCCSVLQCVACGCLMKWLPFVASLHCHVSLVNVPCFCTLL